MTAPTNEMLALADEDALAEFIYEVQDYSHAKRKAALLWPLVRLDAAAPAAGGETPDAWVVQLKYGPDRWSGDMLTDVLPSATETYRIIRPLYAAPPLQAPAHSDAVREALEYAVREIKQAQDLLSERIEGNPARSPGHNARLILEHVVRKLNAALTAPAAKAPAVIEADVGRIVEEHLDSHTFEKNDDGSIVIDRAGMILTMSEDKRLIQSAAQGGGTKSDGGVEGHAETTPVVGGIQRSGVEANPLISDQAGIKPGPSDPPSQEASAPPIAGGR